MSLVDNNNSFKRIFLIGQSGSGKTSCGKALSKLNNWDFLDTDEKLITTYNKSISEIFNHLGERKFRSEELKVIERLTNLDNLIVSTGGGLPKISKAMNIMNKSGVIIWLKCDPEGTKERLLKTNKDHRPLLFNSNMDLLENIAKQAKKRRQLYSQASLHIDTSKKTISEVALEIYNKLNFNNE